MTSSTFTPDKPTAQAQQLAAALLLQEGSPSSPSTFTRTSSQLNPHARLFSQSQGSDESDLSMVSSSTGDQSNVGEEGEELSMEMANDEVTRAFAGHFGSSVPQAIYDAQDGVDDDLNGPGMEEEEEDSFLDQSQGGEMSMEQVGSQEEITRFFKGEHTALVNAQLIAPLPLTAAPTTSSGPIKSGFMAGRKSIGLVLQDEEDRALMASLGLARGGQPQPKLKSRASVSFGGGNRANDEDQEGDDDEEEEDDDDTIDDNATATMILDDDGDRTQAMDMTIASGLIISSLSTSATASAPLPARVGFQGVADSDEEDDDEAVLRELKGNQQESSKISTEFGIPTPSTPTARLQAQIFARQQSLLGNTSTGKAPMSPRRVESATVASAAKGSAPRRSPLKIAAIGMMGTPTRASDTTPSRKMNATATPASTLRLKQQLMSLSAKSPAIAPLSATKFGSMPDEEELKLRFLSPINNAAMMMENSPAAIRGWNESPIRSAQAGSNNVRMGSAKKSRASLARKIEEDNFTTSSFGGEIDVSWLIPLLFASLVFYFFSCLSSSVTHSSEPNV
jgi:hypothetical protein